MQVSRINKKGKTKEQLSKMVNGKSMAKASVWGTAVRFQEGKKKRLWAKKNSINHVVIHMYEVQENSTLLVYPPSKFSEIFFKVYCSDLYSVTGWWDLRALFLVGIPPSTIPAPHKNSPWSIHFNTSTLCCSNKLNCNLRKCPLSNSRNY